MNIVVSSSVDTCLVVATSRVAALWGNREAAVGVNSRYVIDSSNLFLSPNLRNFSFPVLYFALKTKRWKPSVVFLTA